jgi:hypothetical protein
MTKTNLSKNYVKSYSSVWTKVLFTGLPIALSFASPIANWLSSDSASKVSSFMTKIANGYDYKAGQDVFSHDNLKHIGFTALNLSLVGQSLHSLKDLIGKWQQGTEKIVTVKLNGKVEEIVANGKLPLSTYLSDVSMIGGTVGYFVTSNPLGKAAFAVGGVLGNIIFKAFADDSSHEVNNTISGGINNSIVNSNVNSNNTYIYNAGNGDGENLPEGTAFILGLLGVYKVGEMLINDSTPGLYRYTFNRMNGEELKLSVEWQGDNYHIYDQYGREIEVLDNNLYNLECSF